MTSREVLPAKADWDEFEKALKVKFMNDMSVQNFHDSRMHSRNTTTAPQFPSFAKSQEGDAEQVEFILQLLGDGDLRNTVATKFDKLRAGNLHTNGWQLLIRSNLEACCKR